MSAESQTRKRLLEIFSLVNMDSLPAMSDHVTELLSLIGNSRVTAKELSEAILKDYSLATKILQVVNSAYYSRGTPVSTISRAVTVVGLDTLREISSTMALFEEFMTAGKDRDAISATFTLSLISANQSKLFCTIKKTTLSLEEAYICTLLHKLGKIVVLVYLPDLYRAIESHMTKGYSEDHSTRLVLSGLTFSQVGKEIATFWNFSKRIVSCMETNPPKPGKNFDKYMFLQNLVVFSNQLTDTFFNGTDLDIAELIYQFGGTLSLGQEEALELVERSIEICENFSGPMRNGISKLRSRQGGHITVTKDQSGRWVRVT